MPAAPAIQDGVLHCRMFNTCYIGVRRRCIEKLTEEESELIRSERSGLQIDEPNQRQKSPKHLAGQLAINDTSKFKQPRSTGI